MLKRIVVIGSLALLALAPTLVRADVSAGLSVNGQGLEDFYVNIGSFFQVPQAQVAIVRQRQIPDEEAPVVLFLAQQGHVSTDVIVNQRLGGMSWMDIALGLHLNAGTFYVPVTGDPGGPYTSIYAHFKGKKRRWKSIRLRDDEIVNLVNLRFTTQRYGYRPDEVATLRTGGKHFYEISQRDAGGDHPADDHDRRDDHHQDRHEHQDGY
jgi:hypothetical protein